MLSFYLGGGSGCENVLSEIALLEKIFKVLTVGPTLRSSVSLAVMEGTIVSRSRTSKVMCFCLRVLHPKLTFDGFEDVLDRELQRGKVGYSVGSELTLLTVRE